MLEVSNIRVMGHTTKVSVECPECLHKNNYFVHPQNKFSVIRTCYECGAILEFTVEEK